jgi:hypothetical protein
MHTGDKRMQCTLETHVCNAHWRHMYAMHTGDIHMQSTLETHVCNAHWRHTYAMYTGDTRMQCTLETHVCNVLGIYNITCPHRGGVGEDLSVLG